MKKAFTLAEVLITLAIIGVVAALTIPSVVANTQQQEFKTGLRKAVSVLNSAITMNMAIDGESPYDNKNLFEYLQRHMAVMKSTTNLRGHFYSFIAGGGSYANGAFYTTDGMRFEFYDANDVRFGGQKPLYESDTVKACGGATVFRNPANLTNGFGCGGCGSYGLANNPNNTTKPPCLIMVDVNGDRKPTPANANCKEASCAKPYKIADPSGKKLSDIFSIMITDSAAIPYGQVAQKAMYEAQK